MMHRVIVTFLAGSGYCAECSCGWSSFWHPTKKRADAEMAGHVQSIRDGATARDAAAVPF